MKVESITKLAFQVLDKLTDNEDQLWTAHAVFNREAKHTGEIQKIMKDECCLSYDAVQRVLATLVEKEIIYRVRRGKYAPNMKMLLNQMLIELQENPA